MKTALVLTSLVLLTAAAASPAGAGDFGPPSVYADPYDGVPLPPRPVPGWSVPRYGATETVITTTRRVVAAPYGYGAPPAVVTTRRVVAPAPVLDEPEAVATGTLGPAIYPPPRRVLKPGPDYGPVPIAAPLWRERVVVPRPAEPVVVEERRVVTTRRILHPAPVEAFGWDE
jgi:hypothetical protein